MCCPEAVGSEPPASATLLFYCQDSLGLAQLIRSWELARALSKAFRVVFLMGGEPPCGLLPPAGVKLVTLPPVGLAPDGRAISLAPRLPKGEVMKARRQLVLRTFREERPEVLFIELFLLGRRRFASELMPLLEEAARGQGAPLVVCSVADMPVSRGDRQHAHDEFARNVTARYVDAVVVQADPSLARLEDTLDTASMGVPVCYSGFVAPVRPYADETASPAALRLDGAAETVRIVRDLLDARAAMEPHS